jgi:orotate phosphoribosyltransferase
VIDSQLAQEIVDLAYLRGQFVLRSGATASEYFDKYRFEAEPRVLKKIAEHLASFVPKDTDMLAGLELGGVPIATMLSHITGLPTLFVRKKAKDYGTCKFAEGGDIQGKKLLMVEDVVTSGGQIIESFKMLKREGAIISDVICVIDREAGGIENLRLEGLNLHALFVMSGLKQLE